MAHRTLARTLLVALICVGLAPAAAWAVSTEEWESKGADSFEKGKLDGVGIRSDGELARVPRFAKLPTKEVAIWCSATASNGVTYFGTGRSGTIFKLVGKKRVPVVKNTGLIVSAMTADAKGNVYAASLPGGTITKIAPDGTSKLLVRLPKVLYIWSLACDSKGNLYAGTGPNGVLYRVTTEKGNFAVLYDAKADHIFSLAVDKADNIYFGTADGATLMRIDAKAPNEPAAARVVYDFSGNELKAIQIVGETLYLAVNNTKGNGEAAEAMAHSVYEASRRDPDSGAGVSAAFTASAGTVYRLASSKARPELLFKDDDQFITAMVVNTRGTVTLATSAGGGVVQVTRNGHRDTTLRIAVKAKQILTLTLDKAGALSLIGTGRPGALYQPAAGPPKGGSYTSPIHSIDMPARWGQLSWEGAGALTLEARAGDTDKPDETWTGWKAIAKSGDRVGFGETRYVQYRARWAAGAKATLKRVNLSYLPANLPPKIESITVPNGQKKSNGDRPMKKLKIKWEAADPNKDTLGYRVYYRRKVEKNWKLLNRKTLLTDTEYALDVEKLAPGEYQIRVEATDEPSNPAGRQKSQTMDSDLFLLDNNRPTVTIAKVVAAGAAVTITGSAADSVSSVVKIAYALDGGDWKELFPTDEILGGRTEPFSLALTLADKGTHTIAIRATDRYGNTGVTQKSFEVK